MKQNLKIKYKFSQIGYFYHHHYAMNQCGLNENALQSVILGGRCKRYGLSLPAHVVHVCLNAVCMPVCPCKIPIPVDQ